MDTLRKLTALENMWYTKVNYPFFSKLVYPGKEEKLDDYFQVTDAEKQRIDAERAVETEFTDFEEIQ